MATKDRVRGGQDADGTRLREPSVSVRLPDGAVSEGPLRLVTAGQVVAAGPWRSARSARGQAHYPGYYWSATSGGHVIYESRLELARLLLADFDPGVTAIAAQPFLLRALARSWPGWTRPSWRNCGSASPTSRKCGQGSGGDARSWRQTANRALSTSPASRCWTATPPRPPRSASASPRCAGG
jgi:hypothetical protein